MEWGWVGSQGVLDGCWTPQWEAHCGKAGEVEGPRWAGGGWRGRLAGKKEVGWKRKLDLVAQQVVTRSKLVLELVVENLVGLASDGWAGGRVEGSVWLERYKA